MVDVVNPSCFADIVADETPRQRLVRWVMKLSGVSLTNRLPELQGIICRGVDPVSLQSWAWKTNCATSALGFLAAICGSVDEAVACHPLLGKVSPIGMSMPWIFQIGHDLNAMIPYTKDGQQPQPGDLLHYGVVSQNIDHVEWMLGSPDATGMVHTGGGGRPNNAITNGQSYLYASWSRPLQHFLDLDKLSIPFVANNIPTADPHT